jgi:hypothetical protein
MEPMTVTALAAALTALVNGAAGEAGKTSWTALVGLIKTRLGRDSRPAVEAAALERAPADEEVATRLAAALHEAATTDRDTAEWLMPWYAETIQEGAVVNAISGQAQIHGHVVQARTITGGITFGGPPPPQ